MTVLYNNIKVIADKSKFFSRISEEYLNKKVQEAHEHFLWAISADDEAEWHDYRMLEIKALRTGLPQIYWLAAQFVREGYERDALLNAKIVVELKDGGTHTIASNHTKSDDPTDYFEEVYDFIEGHHYSLQR